MENGKQSNQSQKTKEEEKKPVCGIVMPISPIDDCTASHWKNVKTILEDAITAAKYIPNLVSDANDSGIIQKRIVQNLYDNEIVVCDISCKNPNVMFELGMRLAFDKPTIIVIDDKTDYSFDTAPIEHLIYPRNLTYFEIIEFKQNLKEKIIGTIQAAQKPDYTTFLKNFGEFKIARIEHKEGSMNDAIFSRMNEILTEVQGLKQYNLRNIFTEDDIRKRKNNLFHLINDEINSYCKRNNIQKIDLLSSSNEGFEERKKLLSYITRNKQIMELCSLSEIIEAIESSVAPF